MKKQQLKAIKAYFKLLSGVSTKLSASRAFWMFQKVRNKKIRAVEVDFFKEATRFKVPFPQEDINAYHQGPANGKLIFLVHGWDSNAGSLSGIATGFVKLGYRVISLDLPGHGSAKKNYTNLYECKEAVKAVVNHVNPPEPFDVVTHSFGSATAIFALSELSKPVNRMVLLTTSNSTIDFLVQFKNIVGLNNDTFDHMLKKANLVLKEDITTMKMEDKLTKVNFEKSLIIHDRCDKVLPYKSSFELAASSSQVELKTYERIGHYRMLWQEEVIQDTLRFVTT